MQPASTDAPHLLHSPSGARWPASDLFVDGIFGGTQHADTRLCQRASPGGGHVRLVRILSSARPNGAISCETCISSLTAGKPYTAVSYTWGSQLTHRPIILDGHRRLVTENLWRFLNHVVRLGRDFPGSGWLWIDALSIDQRSPRERAYQVGIMANIFGGAERVFVWLGPAYNNSHEAMKALSASVIRLQRDDAPLLPWTELAESAFVGLCERPYWRRTWVFQELRAGQNLHLMCGNDVVPCGTVHSKLWRFFRDFLSYDHAGERLARHDCAAEAVRCSPAWNMIKNVSLTKVSRVQTSLWTLLLSTRDLHCTDPRDRVYSLLSTTTSGHQGIRADYEVSVPRLLNIILRNWHSDLRPSSLQQVSEQCRLLADIFRVGRESIFTLSSPDMSETSYDPDRLQDIEWKPETYDHVRIWAEFHNHKHVCRLLQAATDTTGISSNQVRDAIPSNRTLNTTSTARPQPNESYPQTVAQNSGCGNLLRNSLFPSTWSVAS